MKIKIHVTKDILERSKMCGVKKNSLTVHSCAVAIAVKDIFKSVAVDGITICVYHKIGYTEIDLPEEARIFIRVFDNCKPKDRVLLPEFSFEITIPDSVIDKIGIEQATHLINESKTLELV